MRQSGAPASWRAVPLAALAACALAGPARAQHSYTVGPPNALLEANPTGPPRYDTDRDRSCVGGYNSETPYATNTCIPAGGGQFTMTYRIAGAPLHAARRVGRLGEVAALPAAIAACWSPPPPPDGRIWQISTRFALSAGGRLAGRPRVTYFAGADGDARRRLTESLLDALARCAPFRFTAGLGKAIAGRPIAIRFILQPAPPASGRGEGHDGH